MEAIIEGFTSEGLGIRASGVLEVASNEFLISVVHIPNNRKP